MQYKKTQILEILKDIDYIAVKEPILRNIGSKKVVGWNINASSVLRKAFTIERLRDEIIENQLPLEIKDENQWNNYFKVYIT